MDWLYNALYNTINKDNAFFFTTKSDTIKPIILRKVNAFLQHDRIRHLVPNIDRMFYYYYSLKYKLNETNVKYFIMFNWDMLTYDIRFHSYLRMTYPGIKIVLLLTASVETSSIFLNRINKVFEEIVTMFDIVCTFDRSDAKKYYLRYIPLLYNAKIRKEIYNEYDVCYVGNVKDRLDDLHRLYSYLSKEGLKCCFYMYGVPKEKQKYSGIHYNERITYDESVSLSERSSCILEYIEKKQTFSTIRFGESIVFNKKFITNNSNIKMDDCYHKDYVFVLEDDYDLISFIKKKTNFNKHPKYNTLTERELTEYLK